MTVYEFVEREKAHHPVRRLCRVLGVAPSGYWAWLLGVAPTRPVGARLSERIDARAD